MLSGSLHSLEANPGIYPELLMQQRNNEKEEIDQIERVSFVDNDSCVNSVIFPFKTIVIWISY